MRIPHLRTLLTRWRRRDPDQARYRDARRVSITSTDLAAGVVGSPWLNPLALACNRTLGGHWCLVSPTAFQVAGHAQRYDHVLSAQAQAWLAAWGRGEPLVPVTLLLDDPTQTVAPGPVQTPAVETPSAPRS